MVAKKKPLFEDEFKNQCMGRDNGIQCPLESNRLHRGKRYCEAHLGVALDKERDEEEVRQAAVDERVNAIVPRRSGESDHDWSMRCRQWVLAELRKPRLRPNKDWAHQILAKVARGEQVLLIAREFAEGVVMPAIREPGQEG